MKVKALQFTGKNSPLFKGFDINSKQYGYCMRVDLQGKELIMVPGDWLVLRPDATMEVIGNRQFQEMIQK